MQPQLTPNDVARFWSHVEKTDRCWLWTGTPSQSKPQMEVRGRKYRTSRLAYQIAVEPPPDDRLVCHTCDTPRCCNPAHLFLGTDADNHADKVRKGRQARGDTHGSRTHPERVPRGERHGSHTKPERTPHGEAHYAHLHPETRRGERSGSAKLTNQQVATIRDSYAGGVSRAELARAFGLNWSTIDHIVKGRHWQYVKESHAPVHQPSRGYMHGAAHPASKLTADDVRAIRSRYAAGGISQYALAREYGVCQMSINAIVRQKVWRTLDTNEAHL